MRRLVYVILGLLLFALFSEAIQLTSPFAKISDALKMMREANLSKFEARYYEQLENNAVQCQLCPNRCIIPDLARGRWFQARGSGQ